MIYEEKSSGVGWKTLHILELNPVETNVAIFDTIGRLKDNKIV